MNTENYDFTYDTDKDLIKVTAKLVNTLTNEVIDSQDVTLDILQSSIPKLIDGGVDPSVWTPFTLAGLAGTYDDSEPFNYPVVGRFITPPYFAHDDDDHKYISIVAPPYQGVIDDGSGTLRYNKLDRIEFYLNGNSSKVIVTEPESVTRGYDCYTVKHPFDLTTSDTMKKTNEVRAIIYYEKGEPRILQGMAEPNIDAFVGADQDPLEDPKAIDMSDDFSWNNRGCFIGKYEDYYVGPSGDNTDGESPTTAVLSPIDAYEKAYANGHTNIRINNSHVCTIGSDLGPNAGLTGPAAEYDGYVIDKFFKPSRKLDFGASNPTSGTMVGGQANDFVHRETLPAIVRGGEIWVNNNSADGQDSVYYHGALFKNCDMILNANTMSPNAGRSIFLRNKNKATEAGRRWTDYCAVMFDGCTMGPKEKPDSKGGKFGSIEDHSYTAEVGGYALYLVDNANYYTGNNAAYNCKINYGTGNKGQELVDCDIICPPTQNDIANYTMIVNTNIYDINKHYYPWGSLGSPDGAGTGESVEFGVPISKDRAGDPDLLHEAISYKDTADVTRKFIAERVPYTNDPTHFNPSHLPYDKGFWPDYMMSQKNGIDREDGSPATTDQRLIKMFRIGKSGAEQGGVGNESNWYYDTTVDQNSPWYGKKFSESPRDPHFDVQQFNEVRKNVIVHRMKIESVRSSFQGIFFAGDAHVESGAFWNITWNNPGILGVSMMNIGSTDENNNSYPGTDFDPTVVDPDYPWFGNVDIPTGQFIHYGPNIVNSLTSDQTFKPRDFMSNSFGNCAKDLWIYDEDLGGEWDSIRGWNNGLGSNQVNEILRNRDDIIPNPSNTTDCNDNNYAGCRPSKVPANWPDFDHAGILYTQVKLDNI